MSINITLSTAGYGNRKEDNRYSFHVKVLQLPVRLQECEEVQCCIDMVLRCLIKGLCREAEGAGRLSAVIADWLLEGYTALSMASSPKEWAEFLKVGRQTAQLCMAVRETSVYQAHLCSFFALLGAMPQCLKAEADAILLMIRTARETTKHPAAEAQPSTGDPTAVFILSASLFGKKWAQLFDIVLDVDVNCAFEVFLITQYGSCHLALS